MSVDISGYGTTANLIATLTFPFGISITQFADDADALDIPSIQIRDVAMGLNGDLLGWSKANPIKNVINIIPTSDNDRDLQILFDANRVAQGKRNVRDIITLTFIYPDGRYTTFLNGFLTDGMPPNSIASSSRLKTKNYGFAFQNYITG